MSLISISNLTFSYNNYTDNIFENVTLNIDTDWKLAFIGRNGRGKTTFLKLLSGEYAYSGKITSSVNFDYFPFTPVYKSGDKTIEVISNCIAPFSVWQARMDEHIKNGTESSENYRALLSKYIDSNGYIIEDLIKKELELMKVSADILDTDFEVLSGGEKSKLLLAALFLKPNNFLLIDEPTNHLDLNGREIVCDYLKSKKGFIVVSHDRQFLDEITDHVLSINKSDIELQKGNFSSWEQNKLNRDNFEIQENEKLKKDISRLNSAAARTADWSAKVESTKIGTHAADRGAIGHKAAKMMKRSKSIENRLSKAAEEKSKLLKNIEQSEDLILKPLNYHSERLIEAENITAYYGEKKVFDKISFTVNRGDRLCLSGKNGCGKSTILKLITGQSIKYEGSLKMGGSITVSYISQDTSFLKGSLGDFAADENIDYTLFLALLRKLDFEREQFDKDMSFFSNGQKKKVLIAKSLAQQAHLYVWDEPLNFIDVLSRIQIENLILKYCPTMIFVEHDSVFNSKIATQTVKISRAKTEGTLQK